MWFTIEVLGWVRMCLFLDFGVGHLCLFAICIGALGCVRLLVCRFGVCIACWMDIASCVLLSGCV